MKQKFHKGDLIKVAKDLGESMSHFTNDCDAIVMGSYYDLCGGDRESKNHQYQIHIKDRGRVSWYYENQLTLIEANRLDLLQQWEDEKEKDIEEKSNLDWIFANGKEVYIEGFGPSIETLGKCLGMNNLWGSRGEGFVYYQNAFKIRALAKHFLLINDKDGWLTFSNFIKDEISGNKSLSS